MPKRFFLIPCELTTYFVKGPAKSTLRAEFSMKLRVAAQVDVAWAQPVPLELCSKKSLNFPCRLEAVHTLVSVDKIANLAFLMLKPHKPQSEFLPKQCAALQAVATTRRLFKLRNCTTWTRISSRKSPSSTSI